ncbi:hypothetical protein [Pararhizobium sp. LjRoot238]|uniref:hypothetical protein n=1 Tax=Pararhizobium sp. LjRoot238 TaxID=3342293 RepID=UPI003ED1714F
MRAGKPPSEQQHTVPDAQSADAIRLKIREALDDPRPDVPAADVFARLRARDSGCRSRR